MRRPAPRNILRLCPPYLPSGREGPKAPPGHCVDAQQCCAGTALVTELASTIWILGRSQAGYAPSLRHSAACLLLRVLAHALGLGRRCLRLGGLAGI
jgi:hypothetical protein